MVQTYVDRHLQCHDCFKPFLFSVAEQQFFALKNLHNEPKRCHDCRVLIRAFRNGHAETCTVVACAECGHSTRVPFQPKGHKPVLCSHCFQLKKHESMIVSIDSISVAMHFSDTNNFQTVGVESIGPNG